MSDLLAHIITQTRRNIEILISHNKLSPADGQQILAKLSDAGLSPGAAISTSHASPAHPGVVKARALWGFNEQGEVPGDLSFHEGDIIEIIAETNAEWWTGRLNGRSGLLPANHVQKLPRPNPSPPPLSRLPGAVTGTGPSYPPSPPKFSPGPPSYQPPYSNPPGPFQGINQYTGPPPPNHPTNDYKPYAMQPPQPPPVQAPPPKKHRLGGSLGNTLMQAAAGGVGFGAGSAIGGDLVHSIF